MMSMPIVAPIVELNLKYKPLWSQAMRSHKAKRGATMEKLFKNYDR